MRVVVAHNRYKFAGGEDSVMHSEVEMLRRAGNEVETLEADNRTIEGPLATIAAAGALFHSPESARRMEKLVREFQPDVVHVHNWFPLLSPSILLKAAQHGVPVVQTLHNFRMVCANSALFRDGNICHVCLGKALPIAPVIHGCYSGSHAGSAVLTAGFAYHRLARTWDSVAVFLALTEFQRGLLVRGGVDATKTVVKPNFVRDAGIGNGDGGYALFAGRLTAEKGIRTVLRAWQQSPALPPLKIMGDGPLAGEVRSLAMRLPHVEYLGQQPSAAVAEAMGAAAFLVFASEWYEVLPLVVIEALSRGTPVLAAELPSIAELVKDGETGLGFRAGDAADLSAKAMEMTADAGRYGAMRRNCRRRYEERYTEEINCRLLTEIYRGALEQRGGCVSARKSLTETCA